jgi:hypothetical protein
MSNFNLADYETVDSRIKRFYVDHPTGRITTELVAFEGAPGATRWVVKAYVWRAEEDTFAGTGLAFENDGEGMANKTSALENCETSAIGRALANIGYSGDKRASREEMTKTQAAPVPPAAQEPPADWRARLEAIVDVEALQGFYDREAHNWYTPEVKLAFKARKSLIEAKK